LHRRIANLLLAVLVTTGPGVELIRGFLYHRAEFRVRSGTRTPLRDLVEATCGLVGRGERIDQGDYLLGEWGDRVRQFPVPVGDLPCSLGELPGLRRQLWRLFGHPVQAAADCSAASGVRLGAAR